MGLLDDAQAGWAAHWGLAGAFWGLVGLLGLLLYAVVRLTDVVVAGLDYDWQWQHVTVAVANTVFMAWSEGLRGFQRSFSPRVAARLRWLSRHPSPMRVGLAPLFVMGYFQAGRQRMIGVYALTVGIVMLIVAVHALPQPWRAALDIGVVIGLSWGVFSTLVFAWRAFTDSDFAIDADVP